MTRNTLGALLPCAVLLGAVPPCGAVVSCPAALYGLLSVFVCFLCLALSPVVATYALYWGLDPTATLNMLPKYTYIWWVLRIWGPVLDCTTKRVQLFAVQQPVSSSIGPSTCVWVLMTPNKGTAVVWEPFSGTHRLSTTL